MKLKAILIIIAVVVFGLIGYKLLGEKMVVEKGDKVSVEYRGEFTDGKVFDKSEGRGPLTFTAGAGQMIPGFDKAVLGMKLKEEKTVTLSPEEAYGNRGPLAGKTLVFWIKVVKIEKA